MLPRRKPAINRLLCLRVSASLNTFGAFPISGHRWGHVCLLAPQTYSILMALIFLGYAIVHFWDMAEAILWGQPNS